MNNTLVKSEGCNELGSMQLISAELLSARADRPGMLGFGTAFWVLLLAAFFRWSLGLLAPDNLHSSGQHSGTAEYTVHAMGSSQGREVSQKGSSVI